MRVTDQLDPRAGQPASDGGHPRLKLLSARDHDAREAPTEYRMSGNSLLRTACAAAQPPIPHGRPAFRRIGFQADPGSARPTRSAAWRVWAGLLATTESWLPGAGRV